jgi:hypothetical protein
MTMISSEHPLRASEAFWRVIERCLVEFHGWDAERAAGRVCQLRSALEAFRTDDEPDLILHDDPFEIAGDMAGHYLDPSVYRERYEAIFEACKREYAEKQASAADEGAESRLVGRAAAD